MKTKTLEITILSLLSLLATGSAIADPVAMSNADSTALSTSASASMGNTNIIGISAGGGAGGAAGASVTTGAVTVTPTQTQTQGPVTLTAGNTDVKTGPVTANPTATATTAPVDVKVETGPVDVGLTIQAGEATKIPVNLPGIPMVNIPSPQNFGPFDALSRPTNINNIAPSLYFKSKCKPVYRASDPYTRIDVAGGMTGNTEIVFKPYPTYRTQRATNGPLVAVTPDFPAADGNYVCIGTIMTTAKKGSEGRVNIDVVEDDTVKYVAANLDGFSEIYIVSPEQAIGTAVGASTAGNGFSLGSTAAGVIGSNNPALGAVLGLAAAFSQSAASTHPDGHIGTTYWILGKPKDPAIGTHFSQSDFAKYFATLTKSSMPQAESDGKKLEATKK